MVDLDGGDVSDQYCEGLDLLKGLLAVDVRTRWSFARMKSKWPTGAIGDQAESAAAAEPETPSKKDRSKARGPRRSEGASPKKKQKPDPNSVPSEDLE